MSPLIGGIHGRHDISNQPAFGSLPADLFTAIGNRHRLRHRGMCLQLRFDFSQLNAVATDLNLLVAAAHELQIPVGQVTAQVACFIKAVFLSSGERVRNEPFGCQLRPIQIASGQANATDMDLARHADGQWL